MILMWRGGFNDSFVCFGGVCVVGGGKFKAWLLEREGESGVGNCCCST